MVGSFVRNFKRMCFGETRGNDMYRATWKRSAGILVLAGTLLLGACATEDEVKRAQSTADQALTTAQQAAQAAQAASQKADKAAAEAAAVDAKVDRMFQQNLKK